MRAEAGQKAAVSKRSNKSLDSNGRRLVLTHAEIEAYVEEMQRALDGAGERPERWERLWHRLAPRSPSPSHLVTELRRAYEEAASTCLGCD